MKVRSALIDWLLESSGIAAAYFLFARMALLLPIYPGQASPVWPAAGIALSGVLLFGQRIWPGIFLGSFVATVPLFTLLLTPLLLGGKERLTSRIVVGACLIVIGVVLVTVFR